LPLPQDHRTIINTKLSVGQYALVPGSCYG
jgi:hypothetical protein